MKELLFYVLVAIGCAAGITWLVIQGDAQWGISEKWLFPNIIAFIHGYGYSVKVVLLFSTFSFFLVTGLHRYVARGIIILVIWMIILMIAIAAVYALWELLVVVADHL